MLLCAQKSGQFRVILDTRVVNCCFQEPPTTRLPSACALSSIETLYQHEAYFAGGDIDNAFYRISVPDPARRFMTLPRVKRKYVMSSGDVPTSRSWGETWVTPYIKSPTHGMVLEPLVLPDYACIFCTCLWPP